MGGVADLRIGQWQTTKVDNNERALEQLLAIGIIKLAILIIAYHIRCNVCVNARLSNVISIQKVSLSQVRSCDLEDSD